MSKLALENEIELWTKNGSCKIQLLSGDITSLPVEEKVDFIMVSAFPGDYAPLRNTVIGALKHNLDISVMQLAYDKELDLRAHFSCWLSKTIKSEKSPFKKLLCFEKRVEMSVIEQVSQMFRVFVPVFNNQDYTVITPLLATGHQQQNGLKICETMVKAGAYWINAGLPLRCFKIVIFQGVNQQMSEIFQKLKNKLLAENLKLKKQITIKTYDVFVSFHPEDEKKYVNHIVKSLKKQQNEIKLHASIIKYNHELVWQTDIFKHMVSSKRIIVVLTTLFLESSECLEQYNMAMCCNKLMGGEILAPFYLESVQSMPSYMSLVQWIDCRERKEGDNTLNKIQGACSTVLNSLERHDPTEITVSTDTKQADNDKFMYDVFISYSHKNPKEAVMLLEMFKEVDDSVRVFYDRSALTTGSNWQKMLYHCMGQCKCAIALMSPSYLDSTICMEEYNLAVARFLSQDQGMQFIPVWIEKSDSSPVQISTVPIMDAVQDFDQKGHHIATYVSKWLKGSENVTGPCPFPTVLSEYREDTENTMEEETVMEKLLSSHRTSDINKLYKLKDKILERVKPLQLEKATKPSGSGADIVISSGNDASHLANVFCCLVDQNYPNLKINMDMQQNLERLGALDTARMIVIFISYEFLHTESHMHELHLALTRQRSCDKKILYLIKTTSLKAGPLFFPRILSYDLASTDSVWKDFEKKVMKSKSKSENKKMVITTNRSQMMKYYSCTFAEYFTLVKACDDVLEEVLNISTTTITHRPMLLNLISVEKEVTGKVSNTHALKEDSVDVKKDSTVHPEKVQNVKDEDPKEKKQHDSTSKTEEAKTDNQEDSKNANNNVANDSNITSCSDSPQIGSSPNQTVGPNEGQNTDITNQIQQKDLTKNIKSESKTVHKHQITSKDLAKEKDLKQKGSSRSCNLL